MKGVYLR